MSRPATIPTWATDAVFVDPGELWDGDVTKVDPGAGKRGQGWLPEEEPPAEFQNNEMNLYGEWITYIDGVLNATDVIDPIARTLVLGANRFQLQGGTSANSDWSTFSGGEATSRINFARALLDLSRILPDGAILNRVRAIVTPGIVRVVVGNRMTLALNSRTHDFTIPTIGAPSAAFPPVTDDGGTLLQVVDSGFFALTIDSEDMHELEMTGGNDAGTNNDTFHAVQFIFDDPGPRNF